ncbi:hypothetical protein B0H14DRAFT_2626470 [Mycena olivaceomarginata]|nr:hypothetical protein B0H14DRAFT_2626470 [Mycena olivaceomarginata]
MPSFPPKIGESKAPRMMCSSFEKTSPPPPVNQLLFAVISLHFLWLFTAGYAQATSGGACGNFSRIGQWSEMMSLPWSGYIDPNSVTMSPSFFLSLPHHRLAPSLPTRPRSLKNLPAPQVHIPSYLSDSSPILVGDDAQGCFYSLPACAPHHIEFITNIIDHQYLCAVPPGSWVLSTWLGSGCVILDYITNWRSSYHKSIVETQMF